MKSLDPYRLPHDHHELIAMIAPRAVIALGNHDYEWLGDESGYKSIMAAIEVFKAMGVADHIGYDFTGNHSHCAAARDPNRQRQDVRRQVPQGERRPPRTSPSSRSPTQVHAGPPRA